MRVWGGSLLSACVWSPGYLPAFQNCITNPLASTWHLFLFTCWFFALILSAVDPAAQHQQEQEHSCLQHQPCSFVFSIHIAASMAPVLIARGQWRIPAVSSTFSSSWTQSFGVWAQGQVCTDGLVWSCAWTLSLIAQYSCGRSIKESLQIMQKYWECQGSSKFGERFLFLNDWVGWNSVFNNVE